MAESNAGTVTVKVVPDTTGFHDLLRDGIADALEQIVIDLRTTNRK